MKDITANNTFVEKNNVLKDTYKLLSYSIIFSGLCASLGVMFSVPPMNSMMLIAFFVVYFGLLYGIEKNKNNSTGVGLVFALTGILGLTLSPMLSMLIGQGKEGIIATSLLGTGAIFLVSSWFGRTTKKDLNIGAKFLFPVLLIAFVTGIVNSMFLGFGIVSVAVSSIFLVISTFIIAWQIQNIINEGERSYISATTTLFVSIYNIFSVLLSFLNND